MERDFINIQMEIIMKENGFRERKKVKELIVFNNRKINMLGVG